MVTVFVSFDVSHWMFSVKIDLGWLVTVLLIPCDCHVSYWFCILIGQLNYRKRLCCHLATHLLNKHKQTLSFFLHLNLDVSFICQCFFSFTFHSWSFVLDFSQSEISVLYIGYVFLFTFISHCRTQNQTQYASKVSSFISYQISIHSYLSFIHSCHHQCRRNPGLTYFSNLADRNRNIFPLEVRTTFRILPLCWIHLVSITLQ